MRPYEIGEESRYTVRELLTEMKDISEVIVDLAYASLIFDSQEIGQEVQHLESRVDQLNHEIKVRAMLAARSKEDATMLSGLLEVAEAAAIISRAAGDMVDLLEIGPSPTPFLSLVLRNAEEKIHLLTLSDKSDMKKRTIEEMSVEAETGMRIIAVKRGIRWIYDPEETLRMKAGDVLIVRGTEDGYERLKCFTSGAEEWPEYPEDD
ncbi:MAG: potassium transporter TrkA [Euryarchaeota archaeon]|nr:potassium transporter TrkA [Euryarchaeota archaeon]